LLDFAGKMVTVKGKVYERGGSRAVVIESIEAGKGSNLGRHACQASRK
jgi:hypothetical protein